MVLKSCIHYRAGFEPIARHIVECDGVTSSDYGLFEFRKLQRPAYPLEQYPNGWNRSGSNRSDKIALLFDR